MNRNDSVILPETLTGLLAFTAEIDLQLVGSAFTLDSGFDSIENQNVTQAAGLKPVIYPNRRNAKTPIVIARKFRLCDRGLYKERYKVERSFGWQDTYRRSCSQRRSLKSDTVGVAQLSRCNGQFSRHLQYHLTTQSQ
ncbi:hypothetical protein HYR99_04280 [Candidatus Poribacteria bacterium]|nr:hypothetical protein [Candidatus Poribacteria bacterium]